MKDVRDALMVARRSDGQLVRRPLSPHAGIYRWPITMVSSIANRIAAVGTSLGMILLVVWLVSAASGAGPFAEVQAFLASPLGLLLLGWTAALFFHFFAGLRHLLWDTGRGFRQGTLNPVSWVVVLLTVVATGTVWAAGYAAMGS